MTVAQASAALSVAGLSAAEVARRAALRHTDPEWWAYANCTPDNAHLFGYRRRPQFDEPAVFHALALCDTCTVAAPCLRYHQAESPPAHAKVAGGRVWWRGEPREYERPPVLAPPPSRDELDARDAELGILDHPVRRYRKRQRSDSVTPSFGTNHLDRARQACVWAEEIGYEISSSHWQAVSARLADPAASSAACAAAAGLSPHQFMSRLRRFIVVVEKAYREHQEQQEQQLMPQVI